MKKKYIFCLLTAVLLCLPLVLFLQHVLAEEEKVAYMTFDDGPTLNTPSILETLDKYNAKATFFVLEERIAMYPDYVKQIINKGNAVGLHGISHNEKIYETETSPLKEMEKTNKTLENYTGVTTALVRVPFGSSYRLTKRQADLLLEKGYIIWDWNVDPRDSVGRIVPEKVLANLRNDIKKCKDTPVILFHDRKSTAKLLPYVLEYLTNEGYTLLPISEKQEAVFHLH